MKNREGETTKNKTVNIMKRLIQQIAMGMAIACATSAYGIATLTLSDGAGNTVTLAEGGVPVLTGGASTVLFNANPGDITWKGSLGVWTVNVSTGSSDPLTTAPYPHLDLNSVNTSTAGGTLTIRWTDTSFGPSIGSMKLAASATIASAGGSLAVSVVGNSANTTPTATGALGGTLLTSQTFTGGGAHSGNTVGGNLATLGSSYSITEQVVLTHTGAGTSSMDHDTQIVPEGGTTLLLLGSGLVTLAFFRRKIAAKA